MSQQNVKGSFFEDTNSCDDVPPDQLSGDQNVQKSVLLSDLAQGQASFMLTITTIMKSIIGAGILSLPLTMSRLGYVIGLLLFIFVIALMHFSSVLLLKAKNLAKHSNYSTIVNHIFRNKFAHNICSFIIVIDNTGTCVLQFLIIKGAVGKIFDIFIKNQETRSNFFFGQVFIVLALTCLQLPFTLVSRIQKLRFSAFIGVAGISIFVGLLTIMFFILMGKQQRDWTCHKDMVPIAPDFLKMVVVVPNVVFALSYTIVTYPVFKGMKNATDHKMENAALIGICMCSIFYVLVGNMGYCLYGNNLEGNFLLSINQDQFTIPVYSIMSFSFLLSIFFSFPVFFYGARNNFISITNNIRKFYAEKKKVEKLETEQQAEEDILEEAQRKKKTSNEKKKQTKILFYAFTILLYGIVILLANTVTSIDLVFNFLGSITTNFTCFLFPCMFYFLQITKKNKVKKIQYYLSLAVFCFFIPFGLFTLSTNFISV